MRFAQRFCPKCNGEAKGTVETVQCVAFINFDTDGLGEYAGESDMIWDTQETVTNAKDEVMLTCFNGHDWYTRMYR